MLQHILTILFVATACSAQDARESRIVHTAQGPVRGYKTGDIFHFYGIPYATAPNGTRKFTAPLPGPVWTKPLEAVNDRIICPQAKNPILDVSKYDMQEDCLKANVYVPDTTKINLPVVVYIHGGGYHLGFGELMSVDSLVQTKKLVAVTFNYRLDIFRQTEDSLLADKALTNNSVLPTTYNLPKLLRGPTLRDFRAENAPGNAGMKDQVALLKWIQKNIANFGGNPSEVTIAGYSAGATSVDLLMLSKTTEGLYNKAIPESGAGVGVWSVQLDPVETAKNFAKQLNFNNFNDIECLDQFYTNLSYDDILLDSEGIRPNSTFAFAPCVELKTNIETFLDDTPVNILTNNKYRKVPILYGFTNMDGMFVIPLFEQWKDKMNENFSYFLPADLQFKNDVEREEVARSVKKFYFGNESVSEGTVQGFIDYFTDVMFAYPHLRSVKLQITAGSDSIYLYEYSYFRPYLEGVGIPKYIIGVKGAGHAAQTSAVLKKKIHANDPYYAGYGPDTKEYTEIKKIMVDIWVNFIVTGTPIPEGSKLPSWPPVGANRSPYMELGNQIKLKITLLENRTLFWDDIYERFYKSPVPPAWSRVTDDEVKSIK